MTAPKKPRTGDTTVVAKTGESRKDRISATQILSAAEARAAKGRRPGDSSVILQPVDRIHRNGLGVSVKLALAISAAIAAFMVLFGLVLYKNTEAALNDEIDAAGVQAARVLAAPDFGVWNTFYRAYAGTEFGGIEDEIGRGERTIPSGALSDLALKASQARAEYNKVKLQKLLVRDGRILDALISSPDRKRIVRNASGRPKLDFEGREVGNDGGVAIEYGDYAPPGGEKHKARSYVAPITGVDGRVEGMATVVMSEDSIQKQLGAVSTKILVLALIFVGLGIVVAFWMGTRITSPITALTKDVEQIAKGHLEHRPRVQTKDEIGVLARTIDVMARSLQAAQDEKLEHEKQKHQLAIALEIQSNLFPKTLPKVEGYEVEAHYLPGPEVGGDYYDVFELPDGRLFMMVASASGSGIPAAMLTTMARSFVSALADREATVHGIFKAVNRLLSPDLRRGMYVTALACVLEPKTGKLVVANAGHNPLIRYSGASKGVQPVHSDGIALGFDKGPVFERTLRELEIQLEPGDRIVLCTPGVFGIQNHEGAELGEENFFRLIAREGGKPSQAFVNLVAHALEQFTEGGAIQSDITYLTLKRLA